MDNLLLMLAPLFSSKLLLVYMDGLEPERYYQLMVKTIVGDETLIIDNKDNYFKVVR